MKQVLQLATILLLLVSCTPSNITGKVTHTNQQPDTFDEIGNPSLIDGDAAFPVRQNGEAFILWRGQQLGKGAGILYTNGTVIEIDGSPAFIAVFEKESGVFVDGTVKYRYLTIDDTSFIALNDKPSFVAGEDPFGKRFVVIDGVKQREFNRITAGPILVGNEIVYAGRDGRTGTLIIGEQELKPSLPELEIREVFEIAEINGELAFTARSTKDNPFLLQISNGQEILHHGKYAEYRYPFEVKGNLGYVAKQGNGKSFVVLGGVELGKEFNTVLPGNSIPTRGAEPAGRSGWIYHVPYLPEENAPLDVGGKVAFLGYKFGNPPQSIIVHGDQELGNEFAHVCCPRNINGKLAYTAFSGPRSVEFNVKVFDMSIVYDGQEIGGRFEAVTAPTVAGNNLVFLARKGSSWEVISSPLS